jgi:DNA-binding response OmpR family regulator
MISDWMEDVLSGAGYTVSGIAHNIHSACYEIGLHNCDAVLLDIRLGTEHSPEIADLLKETGTPFAFVTGYDHAVAKRHADVPLLRKPFSPRELTSFLDRLVGSA